MLKVTTLVVLSGNELCGEMRMGSSKRKHVTSYSVNKLCARTTMSSTTKSVQKQHSA
jgi:hypothetical protein